MKPNKCPSCGKGTYNHGSGLYDYYTCGHAYEKPLNNNKKGKMVNFKSPYYPNIYKKEPSHE
jgi:hypothetical protein